MLHVSFSKARPDFSTMREPRRQVQGLGATSAVGSTDSAGGRVPRAISKELCGTLSPPQGTSATTASNGTTATSVHATEWTQHGERSVPDNVHGASRGLVQVIRALVDRFTPIHPLSVSMSTAIYSTHPLPCGASGGCRISDRGTKIERWCVGVL